MEQTKHRSDYHSAIFVDTETAAFLCGLSTKEFNKLYNADGFFKKSVTSDNLIIASTINDWQNGKLARPSDSKQHFEHLAYQNQLNIEKQERIKAKEKLDNNIIEAFQAKKYLKELKNPRR